MKKIFLLVFLLGCFTPAGNRREEGAVAGAATGALTGMVVAVHAGSAYPPAALAGAGFGAVAGGVKGYFADQLEAKYQELANEKDHQKALLKAQLIVLQQLEQRKKLHPTRDIFPSDLFFLGDEHTLRPGAEAIIEEIAIINKERFSWSPLVVASYVQAGKNDSFAKQLAGDRAKIIANKLIKYGISPRRVEARPIIITETLLLDPEDRPDRYSQAIEFIADRK